MRMELDAVTHGIMNAPPLLAPVFGLVSTWMRNTAEDASSKKILGLASLLLGLFAWLGEKFGLITRRTTDWANFGSVPKAPCGDAETA
jgi:hypothetical protein